MTTPTDQQLAVAREIYDREIALPKAPMCGSIERIAAIIPKHDGELRRDNERLRAALEDIKQFSSQPHILRIINAALTTKGPTP